MLVFLKFLEFRQMSRHLGIRKSLTIPAFISHTQPKEVITHNTTNIKISVQRLQRLIVKKFMFRVSHRDSHDTLLTSNQ